MKTVNKENIIYATLLTLEEAEKVPVEYRKCSTWWWLSSSYYSSNRAAFVLNSGYVTYNSDFVSDGGVRPVLICKNLKSSIGDIYSINGIDFIYVGENKLLARDIVAECPYRTLKRCKQMADNQDNWWKEDKSYSDYETSDVKKYVDEWFKKEILKEGILKIEAKTIDSENVVRTTLLSTEEIRNTPNDWWVEDKQHVSCGAKDVEKISDNNFNKAVSTEDDKECKMEKELKSYIRMGDYEIREPRNLNPDIHYTDRFDVVKWYKNDNGEDRCISLAFLNWNKKESDFELEGVGLRFVQYNSEELNKLILFWCDSYRDKMRQLSEQL